MRQIITIRSRKNRLSQSNMFLKKTYRAIIMVAFVIISEVIIKFFPEVHHATITWGDMLYYFFAQIGYISFLPSIFLYQSSKNINEKGIYLGLVFWNVVEVLQEFNVLLKLNIEFFNKSDSQMSDIMQILFIIFTVILTHYGYKKWHT